MHVLVLLRMVPDVVEELEIAPEGNALDPDALRMILSESDDHALEQALLLKERHGGRVTVLAPDAPEVDDALFTALAKGADRAVKITGLDASLTARGLGDACRQVLASTPGLMPADLILTGAQAFSDLDAVIAPLLAYHLGLPHVGIVSHMSVNPAAGSVTVLREYAGGVRAEFEVPLPGVIGIQSAEKPPRYVPVAKVRAAMKSQKIETAGVPVMADGGEALIQVTGMLKPEAAGHAEMLEGSPEEVAGRICDILAARGLLQEVQ
jgi:electron transfer flavoprotein beta subunit